MAKFIKELKNIKKKFIAYAYSFSSKVYKETFVINICNGYLSLRIEAENQVGDIIVFKQKIEMEANENYQKPLLASEIKTTVIKNI